MLFLSELLFSIFIYHITFIVTGFKGFKGDISSFYKTSTTTELSFIIGMLLFKYALTIFNIEMFNIFIPLYSLTTSILVIMTVKGIKNNIA